MKDKLSISVYHLQFISNLIIQSIEGLHQFSTIKTESSIENKKMDLILFETTLSLVLIRLDSLKFEYEKHFEPIADSDSRVKKVTNICEPIWECIARWKEIGDFRNNVLAHNLRVKNGKWYESVFFEKSFTEFDIPNSIQEIIIVKYCIEMFRNILLEFFEEEYQIVRQKINQKQKKQPVKVVDHEEEINQLMKQVKDRRNELS